MFCDAAIGFTDDGGGGGSVLPLVLAAAPVAARFAAAVEWGATMPLFALAFVFALGVVGAELTCPAAPPTPPAAHALLAIAPSATNIGPMMRMPDGATRGVPRGSGARQRVKVPSGADASTLPCAAGVGSTSCSS
ncbi:MAG TPA: hypothetical protein VF997_15565, partial [Polyangia bacterium]